MGARGPKTDKPWADAIRKAVNDIYEEKTEDGKVKKTRYLRRVAENLVKKAMTGDVAAIKEIGDRLDGKPVQPQEIKGDADQPLVVKIIQFEEIDDDFKAGGTD